MALVPIISQTWDTTSVFNPTRMNNIENNIAIVSKATGVEYSSGVSVKDKIDSVIQAPDLSNITRESLTSGTAVEITSTGKWYCVTSENQSSGACSAYILDSENANYLSASQTPDGDWKRATTSWLYFPVGAKFYARAIFTYKGQLCSAPSL